MTINACAASLWQDNNAVSRSVFEMPAYSATSWQMRRSRRVAADITPTTYLNGRIVGWEYDAAGRVTRDGDGATYQYDAAGLLIEKVGGEVAAQSFYTYNGDGVLLKQETTRPRPNQPPLVRTSRYLPSAVLGLAVAEVSGSGAKSSGAIYVGGRRRAVADSAGVVSSWSYEEPVTGSEGTSSVQYGNYHKQGEYDAGGVNVGFTDPAELEGGGEYVQGIQSGMGLGGCSSLSPNCAAVYWDGMESNWDTVLRLARMGAATIQIEKRRGGMQNVGLDISLGALYVPDHYQNYWEEKKGAYVPTTTDPNGPVVWDPEATVQIAHIGLVQGRFVLPTTSLLLQFRQDLKTDREEYKKRNREPQPKLEEPCKNKENVKADTEHIRSQVGATFYNDNLVQFPFPWVKWTTTQSYNDIIKKLRGINAQSFINPGHWGSKDFKIQGKTGLWYHINVSYPYRTRHDIWGGNQFVFDGTLSPPEIVLHCHATSPNGFWHILNFLHIIP